MAGEWKDIELPCGQCIGCRLDYAKQWATRIMLESQEHENNYFITLTYNAENLPTKPVYGIDKETGEIIDQGYKMVLQKKDFQDFMKRLRERYRDKGWTNIRFFARGEYGDESGRPHYHAILFNCPIPDLEPFFINHEHQQVYLSPLIEQIWGKGQVSIGEVTYQSAAYVARYIMKKQKGETALPKDEEEFTLMSRKPGIAEKYFRENMHKLKATDEIILLMRKGKSVAVKPPRYYEKMLEEVDKVSYDIIKKHRREVAQENRVTLLTNTTLTEKEYLCMLEKNKTESVKRLKRGLTNT